VETQTVDEAITHILSWGIFFSQSGWYRDSIVPYFIRGDFLFAFLVICIQLNGKSTNSVKEYVFKICNRGGLQ